MFREGFSKWLLHDDQKALFEILFALVLNIVFLALSALLLWPLGKTSMTLRLAMGYGVLWILTLVIFSVASWIQRLFRIDMYDHSTIYVLSNLSLSCLLQVGWSAFVALAIQDLNVTSWGGAAILYLIGVLSCVVAYVVVSAFYQGHIYRLISLPLSIIGFIVFSVWLIS